MNNYITGVVIIMMILASILLLCVGSSIGIKQTKQEMEKQAIVHQCGSYNDKLEFKWRQND